MERLAIITSHPIQYNAPLFELLASRNKIKIKVFYTWGESVLNEKYDPGFGRKIEWDIPLLKGYDFEFLENIAIKKGSHHFNGINNPAIIERLQQFNPGSILVYGWAFKSHLKVLRFFKNKVQLLFRGDSNLLDETGFLQRMKRMLFLKWIYHHVDVALFVGKSNYDYFRKAGLKKSQLQFAPHAVDNRRFMCDDPACLASARALRTSLNIAATDVVFLFAGKMEPKKDPLLLISAFLHAGLDKTAHLVIAGNGPLENEIKTLYEDQATVHFLPFQNQAGMPALYEMSDVFVLPSKGPGETWGLAINEAMANSKPVIVSDKCGCAADLVENAKNGFVFPAGNETALAEAYRNMFAQKKNIVTMGKTSFEKIQSFSLEKLALAIETTVLNKKSLNMHHNNSAI